MAKAESFREKMKERFKGRVRREQRNVDSPFRTRSGPAVAGPTFLRFDARQRDSRAVVVRLKQYCLVRCSDTALELPLRPPRA